MTTPAPQRRTQRKTHLDASVVPVERAFLARAAALDAVVAERTASGHAIDLITLTCYQALSGEFRAVAEEFHWHG